LVVLGEGVGGANLHGRALRKTKGRGEGKSEIEKKGCHSHRLKLNKSKNKGGETNGAGMKWGSSEGMGETLGGKRVRRNNRILALEGDTVIF